MRNLFMKEIRNEWKDTARFYFGSNRVMAKALGTDEESEYLPSTAQVAARLSGNVGLMFTDAPQDQVLEYFANYSRSDFPRAGAKATATVTISQGPLMRHGMNMPNNMEVQLRKLGMPTELKQGVLCLRQDYTICKEGAVLTSDQAHLLKHFGHQLADFKIVIVAHWAKDGTFTSFEDAVELDDQDAEDMDQ
ncbi:hypothetical protein HDV03_000483 [Kappamyces sp. JEL0829]|nr:hypothetical protein HDV03_000483 [Kappamyces sp. JEL0829]